MIQLPPLPDVDVALCRQHFNEQAVQERVRHREILQKARDWFNQLDEKSQCQIVEARRDCDALELPLLSRAIMDAISDADYLTRKS